MPDVNLIKDTEGLQPAPKKPVVQGTPEMTDPSANVGTGLLAKFKSLFNRGPKPLPTAAPIPAMSNTGTMSLKRTGTGNDRILSEKKTMVSNVIPLPDDDDAAFNVNLLSEDLSPTDDPRRRAILLGVFAAGALVVVGLAYGGLLYYKQSITKQIDATETKLNDVKTEITSLTPQQQSAASTVQKLTAIGSLIERHKRWTKFFSLLERYTLPSVTYGATFTGDVNGTFALSAKAETYEQIAQQYLLFQQLVQKHTFISSFSISSAQSSKAKDEKSAANFVISMTVFPEVFTMTAEEAKKSASANTGSSVPPAIPVQPTTPDTFGTPTTPTNSQ